MLPGDSERTVEVCLGVTGLKGAFSRGVVSEARHVLGPLWLTVLMLLLQTSGTVISVCMSVERGSVCITLAMLCFQRQNAWFSLSSRRSGTPGDYSEDNKGQLFPKQQIQRQ